MRRIFLKEVFKPFAEGSCRTSEPLGKLLKVSISLLTDGFIFHIIGGVRRKGTNEMSVKELNREQLTELKGNYLMEKNAENGEGTSYMEIADADSIISDDEIFDAYAGTEFSEDDFCC